MANDETNLVETWLATKLIAANITGSRVYSHRIPQRKPADAEDYPYPCIEFQLLDGRDLMVVGQIRIWLNSIYFVKVVGKNVPFEDITAAFTALDTALHVPGPGSAGQPSGGVVYACTREAVRKYVERDGDQFYSHLGGEFRILAQAT